MRRVELQVERLTVETEAERSRLDGVPERLREAFELLAKKLQASPAARGAALREIVMEQLLLKPRSAEEILGPGGAESLAEELYAQLVRGT